MNPKAEFNKGLSMKSFKDAKIPYTSLNNDMHWKVIDVDFWPTSLKWQDLKSDKKGVGVFECIEYLRTKYPMYVYTPKGIFNLQGVHPLTVDQMFDIACHSKEKSLIGICRTLHKEIYG